MRPTVLACLALLIGALPASLFADAPSFTAAQAAKGKAQYLEHCATCHGARLEGEHITPALAGDRFDRTWRGKSAAVLTFHLNRMPPEPVDSPGGLGDEVYANVLSYILESNGFEPGDQPFPSDREAQSKLTIPALEGSDYDPYEPAVAAAESEVLKALPTLTAKRLQEPSPDDWLMNGRAYDSQSFSPLADINRDNVQYLTTAWRAPLVTGMSMPMPLVHHGVMFLHTYPDTVLALDATNGQILWRHRYEPTGVSSQKLGLGLAGDKVLVPTSDLHVLALNAKTGELVWDHELVVETPAMRAAYQLRSAPFVVGDKVIQGVTASFVPKGGFAVAIDLDSGKEAWRFHTIARPGEPYGESWNDVPLEKRSGGSIWHQMSYDPELDLLYFGIAPTYDTGPLVHSVGKSGVTSDALYTNCTVALKPETGELVWHYQHVGNDQWDLDWVFERQIVELPVGDAPEDTRKAVMNVGKMAILEAVDAATGEYLFSVDPGIQNVISAIDPETGAKTIDLTRWPDPEKPTDICPSAYGARSWPPTAYSPETHFAYLPLTESCMRFGKEGGRLLTSGVGISGATHPDSADGKLGRLQAIDVVDRKLAWRQDIDDPILSGLLATAGGLVFSGDMAPSLKAFDDRNGKLLWEVALEAVPSSAILTYKVDGRQYVAVVAGMRNLHVGAIDGSMLSAPGRGGSGDNSKAAAILAFGL